MLIDWLTMVISCVGLPYNCVASVCLTVALRRFALQLRCVGLPHITFNSFTFAVASLFCPFSHMELAKDLSFHCIFSTLWFLFCIPLISGAGTIFGQGRQDGERLNRKREI